MEPSLRTLAAVLYCMLAAACPAGAAENPNLTKIEVRAQLVPVRYTTLSAEIGAKVLSMPVLESGRFKTGDLLVELDSSLQATQLQRAEAELRAAQAVLSAQEELRRLNSVGSLELAQAQAAVGRAEAEVATARVLVERSRIRAPYPGRVAERRVRELQYVQPGQPVLEIIDDGALELEFIVPSQWLTGLAPGQPLVVTLDETGHDYTAVLTRLGVRVDPVSQTVKATAVVTGEHPELVPGMSGRVHVPAGLSL